MPKRGIDAVICITSGGRGGTGKTTFSQVALYVWSKLKNTKIILIDLSKEYLYKYKRNDIIILDFPAFQMTDLWYIRIFIKCKKIIYIVDEDYDTYIAIEKINTLARDNVAGVIINKIIGNPNKNILNLYKKYGKTFTVRFDKDLAIHRTIGISPLSVRSVAIVDMVRAAVSLEGSL